MLPRKPGKVYKRMRQGRSTGAPTKAQRERFDAIKEGGCVVAYALGLGFVPCELHHLTEGGRHGAKRRGQDFVVGLNPWSHRGVPFGGWDAERCREVFGPSYASEPRAFRALYSDDRLMELQNELLAGRKAA